MKLIITKLRGGVFLFWGELWVSETNRGPKYVFSSPLHPLPQPSSQILYQLCAFKMAAH